MKKAYYMAGLIAFVSVCIVNPTYAGSGGGSFNPHGTHVAPSTASQMQEVHNENTSTEKADSDREISEENRTVSIIQQFLNSNGYDCGTPDGILGPNTKSMIEEYQSDNNLEVTGTITTELVREINHATCISAKDFVERYNSAIDAYNKELSSTSPNDHISVDDITSIEPVLLNGNGKLSINDGSSDMQYIGAIKFWTEEGADLVSAKGEAMASLFAFDTSLDDTDAAWNLIERLKGESPLLNNGILYQNDSPQDGWLITGKTSSYLEDNDVVSN